MPPPSKGGQEFLKQTTKHNKVNSQTLKKVLVCCYVDIKIQRLFVEMKVVFLQHFKSFKNE